MDIQVPPNFVFDPTALVQLVARVVPADMSRSSIMSALNPHIDTLMYTLKPLFGGFDSQLRDWKENIPD